MLLELGVVIALPITVREMILARIKVGVSRIVIARCFNWPPGQLQSAMIASRR
jgi:hypothetical protein